ncbi:alpha/beta hydrolase family protein [Streptomyces fructofermentans]|uniref:alpha/beta hydrolase family protein n=1 Tax=Streptomyces fructofermentans TaxID=152141 RepID=UPI00379D3179
MKTSDAPPHGARRSPAGPARRTAGRRRPAVLAAVITATLLGTLGNAPATRADTTRPTATACPADLADKAECFNGRDANGAYYTMAVPRRWNGSLVVHAHGGPDFSYDSSGPTEDLARWAVMVDQGYAWAGSSYRRGGYGVRMAAADTENVRRLFTDTFGRPDRTYLHGQSWGGNVAAKAAETYGRQPGAYDGVLLTNGLLAGGSRGYDHRVDLRVVHQFYCRNLPRASEPQYPLWQGLPADSDLSPADVHARLQECTGIDSDPADRTARQQRNLDDILAVTGIPERSLDTNLLYATFLFQDIVSKRLGGRNPFTNQGVRYGGSHDDRALNAGVARFSADPTARRDLSYDSDLTGRVPLPVLTLHAIDDPQVVVEHEAAYRATLRSASQDDHLVQTFTTESEHSELSDSEYANSLSALATWVRTGRKPTPRSIARTCEDFDSTYGTGCHYDPGFSPAPYATRILPRPGGLHWPVMTAAQERAWSRIDGVGIAP